MFYADYMTLSRIERGLLALTISSIWNYLVIMSAVIEKAIAGPRSQRHHWFPFDLRGGNFRRVNCD
jgi:hypothetical protein